MRKLTLDANDLSVQSFNTASTEATLRGAIASPGSVTAGCTCGNPPAPTDEDAGPTADYRCCI
jgi:hypothetical protein